MLINFRKSKAHPTLGLCERAMCCLWLHAVLSSGRYGKEGGGRPYWLCPHNLLVLIRQSVFQSNLSISVSYHSFSKVKWLTNLVFIETEITLFKRVELCQETIQSKKLIYRELFYPLLGSSNGSIIIFFFTISIFVYL